jgi:hypothetical protein
MKRMAVLAISEDANGLLFVLLEFSRRGTDLYSGRSSGEAAVFLERHPGALVLCDRLARDTLAGGPLAKALEASRPCAVVWMDDPGPRRAGIEIERCGDIAAARRLLADSVLLQKIHVAWRQARECGLEPAMTGSAGQWMRPV